MMHSFGNHVQILVWFSYQCALCYAQWTIVSSPLVVDDMHNVTITCNIPNFNGAGSWFNGSDLLTICYSAALLCIPDENERYTFTGNASSISVHINGVDSSKDSFIWNCQHNSNTTSFKLTFRGTSNTTPLTTTTQSPVLSAIQTDKTTDGNSSSLQTEGCTPIPCIVSSSVASFVFIIIIIAIIIYCNRKNRKGTNCMTNNAKLETPYPLSGHSDILSKPSAANQTEVRT